MPTPSSPTNVFDRGAQLRRLLDEADPPAAPTHSASPVVDLLDQDCFDRVKIIYPKTYITFFIPWSDIVAVLSLAAVQRALRSWYGSDRRLSQLSQAICSTPRASHRRILGILVYLGKGENIREFVRQGLDDTSLPLDFNVDRTRLTYTDDAGSEAHVEFLPSWRSRDFNNFYQAQFAFLSPFFFKLDNREPLHYLLDEKDILPVVEESDWSYEPSTAPGPPPPSACPIKRVRFHPDHYHFGDRGFRAPERGPPVFAMKCLRREDRENFRFETSFLRRISHVDNAHLNRLLVSFETQRDGGSFYLVFPWAECDLITYCRDHDPAGCDTAWAARQCAGLASALAAIHDGHESQAHVSEEARLYGRHGDLKPENILWFPADDDAGGVLVMNDFGLSRHHRQSSRSNGDPSTVMRSPTYLPPECELRGGLITRKFDIWGLGATFLEFAIWHLKGYEAAYEDFPAARSEVDGTNRPIMGDKYFCLHGDEASLKPSVTSCIEELREHPRCSHFIRGLLHLIVSGMLVVDPSARLTAKEVHSKLERLCSECQG